MLVHFLKTVDREDSGYPCQCKHDHVLACVGREDLGCPCQSPIINHQLSIIDENIMSGQVVAGRTGVVPVNYELSIIIIIIILAGGGKEHQGAAGRDKMALIDSDHHSG